MGRQPRARRTGAFSQLERRRNRLGKRQARVSFPRRTWKKFGWKRRPKAAPVGGLCHFPRSNSSCCSKIRRTCPSYSLILRVAIQRVMQQTEAMRALHRMASVWDCSRRCGNSILSLIKTQIAPERSGPLRQLCLVAHSEPQPFLLG
jgi:hypothetical protein